MPGPTKFPTLHRHVMRLTRVPDVLDPDVGARREEQPVDRDEEEADHVTGQGDADEEY